MNLKRQINATLNDFDNRSQQLQKYIIYFSFGLHLLIYLCDLLLEFELISSDIILWVVFASGLITLGNILGKSVKILGLLNLILFYLSFEIHYLLNPKIFYFVGYWFAYVIITAVVSGGIRQSLFWLGIVFITIVADYFHFSNIFQQNEYVISIPIIKSTIGAIIFLGGIFMFICIFHWLLGNACHSMKERGVELQQLRFNAEKKRRKLEKYQKAHFRISGDSTIVNGALEDLYKNICKLTYENMETSRVSIWTFDSANSALKREYLFSKEEESDEKIIIETKNHPTYIKAITVKKFIAAEDVLHHPDTTELYESYLKPHNIRSMLDSPFLVDGALKGVICCEKQYETHKWTSADILFIQSLSDFISLAHKSHESQSLLRKIQAQNEELLKQRQEIEAMNEQLSLMNLTLESKVRDRTSELEQQNHLLKEYAFINSHQLRAPLSRILGLSHLISNRLKDKTDLDLLTALTKSTDELDLVVNRIGKLLYDGNKLCRDDIRVIIEDKIKK